MTWLATSAALVCGALVVASTSIAAAEGPAASGAATAAQSSGEPKRDPTTVAAARALAQQGVRLAESGDCASAVEKLERAEALVHSPIVAEQLATCLVESGRLVEAVELYRGVLREPLPAQPSTALRRAYERAEQGLAGQRPRLAVLVVHVDGSAAATASVSLDGKEIPRALLGAERLSDPGEHDLEASATAHAPVRRHITLTPGERQELSLTLEPLPQEAVVSVAGTAASAPSAAATRAEDGERGAARGRALRIASYALWGAGAAALGVGAGFGLAAMARDRDLDDACAGNVCPESQKKKLDAAQRAGNVASAGLVGGALLAVTGTVLYFVAPRRSERAPLPVAIDSDGRRTMARLQLTF